MDEGLKGACDVKVVVHLTGVAPLRRTSSRPAPSSGPLHVSSLRQFPGPQRSQATHMRTRHTPDTVTAGASMDGTFPRACLRLRRTRIPPVLPTPDTGPAPPPPPPAPSHSPPAHRPQPRRRAPPCDPSAMPPPQPHHTGAFTWSLQVKKQLVHFCPCSAQLPFPQPPHSLGGCLPRPAAPPAARRRQAPRRAPPPPPLPPRLRPPLP